MQQDLSYFLTEKTRGRSLTDRKPPLTSDNRNPKKKKSYWR